jgi:putative transposase
MSASALRALRPTQPRKPAATNLQKRCCTNVALKRPPVGLILHSDRGSQYCSHDYRDLAKQFGMTMSMSRKGDCYDNAPMESFWGSLKNELVHHRRFTTRAEARQAITEYIEIFYNRQRKQARLGYLSPAAFTQKFYKTQLAA